MNLHKLRVFCEVVERQSLTLAAQHLLVSQPVVSVHIHDLEKFYGGKLLYQQGRRMMLTEAGEIVHRHALEVLRATDETIGILKLLETGRAGAVAIGANMVPGTYLLPRKLAAFKLQHPDAEISFTMSDSVTVREQIHRGQFDFAVITLPEPPPGFQVEVLCYDDLVLVVSPRHPLARRRSVALDELRDEEFVCSPFGDGRRTLVDARLRAIGLSSRKLVIAMSHPEAMKDAVQAGIGIALMFRCSVERELNSGELLEVPIDGHALTHPFYLISNTRKRFSPVQRQLIDFLMREMGGPTPRRAAAPRRGAARTGARA